MKNICIISPSKNAISETFIQAQFDYLEGNIFILYGSFPNLYYNNREVKLFYRKNKILYKLKKLLPHFLYDKYISPKEQSEHVTEDVITTFFKTHKIDIVLAQYGHSGALILPYVKKLNIPLIVHFHGMDANHSWYLERYMSAYKAMFSYAKNIISVSEVMHNQLLSYGAPKEKTVLNPYGARLYFFDIQPKYDDLFISVSRFADTKAPYLTIMAFAEVVKYHNKARLIYFGDGILREACINLTKSLGIEGYVNFAGAVKHTEIIKKMPRACCFIQHSITTSTGEMEGTPNTILEAQASSLPVVSTRHAGISQAVLHEKTGFLVDELDYNKMAEYMLLLIKDKALCKQMGEAGRAYMKSNYSFDHYIETIQRHIDTN